MKIVMIGSGNMATFLAQRFLEREHQIVQVYSRELSHAEELALHVSAKATHQLDQVITDADVYILAVKDDLLSPILMELKSCNGSFVHLSGSVPSQELLTHRKELGCLWCMYSIQKNQLPLHRKIPVFIQYHDPLTEHILFELAGCISDEIKAVSDDEKGWLHLSAVFANNFTNHMVSIAQELLKENHLDDTWIFPILEQTVTKIKNQSAKRNQTGPALRKDDIILSNQWNQLNHHPEWQQVYEAISSSIKSMYGKENEEI